MFHLWECVGKRWPSNSSRQSTAGPKFVLVEAIDRQCPIQIQYTRFGLTHDNDTAPFVRYDGTFQAFQPHGAHGGESYEGERGML